MIFLEEIKKDIWLCRHLGKSTKGPSDLYQLRRQKNKRLTVWQLLISNSVSLKYVDSWTQYPVAQNKPLALINLNQKWKCMLNEGYRVATAEKCSLKHVFRKTMIWKGESVLCSQSSRACWRHSWKNLMLHSTQTLFFPLGIFWSRYWLVEYYNGEYQSQSLQKQCRLFLLCTCESYPNMNYFTPPWNAAVLCVPWL